MTKIIRSLEFHSGTREEKLPGYSPGFPYIASRAELDFYRDRTVPWHWHRAVELFYMESGSLTYHTPDGAWHFPAGSGEIWLGLLELFLPSAAEPYPRDISVEGTSMDSIAPDRAEADSVKTMMIYIHEHFSEKISVAQLPACAYLSERDCYRVFQECLHMTPVEYMKNYRLQTARRMLAEEDASVTDVGHACGFGSVSYFARLFRESEGCTPSEYRRRWHGENNPARKQENPAG